MSRIYQSQIDEEEFLKIAKGRLRNDLKRYLSRGEIRIPRGGAGGTVSIPIETIEIPTFRYGYPLGTELGQGDGEVGDDLGPVQPNEGEGQKGPGGQGHGGRNKIEIELPLDEFRKLFQEELELPNIQPKGNRAIFEVRERYSSISKKGSASLLHLRRTIMEALKRAIADRSYDPPKKTVVIPNPDERRYKSYEEVLEPKNNAVCFWKRDGSGSMGTDERRVVSILVDMCQFWLSCFYDKLEHVYIIHDDRAFEVTREEFFGEHWGGGTTCSSVLTKMLEIIGERYPVHQWNIYGTYLSDGMNWSSDNAIFADIMQSRILPIVNQYNYGEILLIRPWWEAYQAGGGTIFSAPGTIGNILEKLGDVENLAIANIDSDEDEAILDAIRVFFGKGN